MNYIKIQRDGNGNKILSIKGMPSIQTNGNLPLIHRSFESGTTIRRAKDYVKSAVLKKYQYLDCKTKNPVLATLRIEGKNNTRDIIVTLKIMTKAMKKTYLTKRER